MARAPQLDRAGRWRLGGALLLVVAAAALAWAAADEPALPADIALIPGDGAVVVSFRVADAWNNPLAAPLKVRFAKEIAESTAELEKNLGAKPEQIERVTIIVPSFGPSEVFAVHMNTKYDRAKVVGIADKDAKEEKYKGRSLFSGARGNAVCLIDEQTFVVGRTDPVKSLLDREIKEGNLPLSAAKRLMTGKHAIVVGVNLPGFMAEVGERLPGEVDAVKPLFDAKSAAFALDLSDEANGVAKFEFTDETAAKKGEKGLTAGLELARTGLAEGKKFVKEKSILKLLDQLDDALKNAKVARQGDKVEATTRSKLDVDTVAAALMETVFKTRSSAARAQSQNNMRQIGLAMHNYHSVYNHFPANAIYDAAGKPLLSWRVQILPFIEQEALYKKFHLDEPWDSEHNKKLIEGMPRTYASPNDPKGDKTHYLVFHGKGTIFEGKKGIGIAKITDGTSNTILVVEAKDSVPWTKPEDIEYDAAKPLPKLGVTPDGFNAGYADGSVRFHGPKIKPESLRLRITRNDGEAVPDDE